MYCTVDCLHVHCLRLSAHVAVRCAAATLLPSQALSAGREWDLLEPLLLTPKGYKLLQCCHMALEQLQKVLALQQQQQQHDPSCSLHGAVATSQANKEGGDQHQVEGGGSLEAAARQAVGWMCEGRLMPTTWLNAVRNRVCLRWRRLGLLSTERLAGCFYAVAFFKSALA